MVLQLLRWLYLIVGDSHFGYFACFQNARSIINGLCFGFAFKNQAERQSFFPIDLPTHSNTPLQEPKNFDNCYTLTFILLARLGKSWKTFSGKLVWTIDSISSFFPSITDWDLLHVRQIEQNASIACDFVTFTKIISRISSGSLSKKFLPAVCCCLSLSLSWSFH